ncbi:MAG: galactokinase [Spirochaetaceae bacterium]|jgi:galactokinase|nr:galactokinase [Spirochaetaceae bacterium]
MKDIGPLHRAEYETEADQNNRIVIGEAPGRIHYLGEHGEPGWGMFLSSAINRSVQAAVSLRKDNSLRFFAADLGERKRTTLINLKYKREDRWANYIKVAVHAFAERGFPIKGLNFTISGDIPQQIGLASSSAIEVAAAVALKGFFQARISDRELLGMLSSSASLFFGKQFNPVDYLIALSARKDHFLIVDEEKLEARTVKVPLGGYKILLMDSRVPRMGVEEELKHRVQDIRRGLDFLSNKREGASFRDYVTSDIMESMGNLPEQIRRRCLHIVKELQRVEECQDILRKGDFASLSRLILHSHESLRDLYEVSCPEIDWLVKRAQETEGVVGSRMTGEGFGGCTYTIVDARAVDAFNHRLEDYERIFGFHLLVHEIRPAGAACIL